MKQISEKPKRKWTAAVKLLVTDTIFLTFVVTSLVWVGGAYGIYKYNEMYLLTRDERISLTQDFQLLMYNLYRCNEAVQSLLN